MSHHPNSVETTVCFWNILFDALRPSRVAPQAERLPAIIETLQALPHGTVIGLGEIEGQNGELIADRLSATAYAHAQHHRDNDYIGMLSPDRAKIATHQLSEDCQALVTVHNGITIAAIHLTFSFWGESLHRKQLSNLLGVIDSEKPAVIMGDFNSVPWQKSRRYLNTAGYVSVFERAGQRRTPTAPAPHYRYMYPQPFRTLSKVGFASDDIYVRGLEVVSAGTFSGESDHLGVWARVENIVQDSGF